MKELQIKYNPVTDTTEIVEIDVTNIETPNSVAEPTLEDRLKSLEQAMLDLLGGN